MTNAGQTTLVKLAKAVGLGSYSKILGPLSKQPALFTKDHKIACSQLYLLTRRFIASEDDKNSRDDADSTNQHKSNSSSSTSHQKNHRRSYEHKKSSYERSEDDFKKNSKSNHSISSDQMNHYQRLNIQKEADLETIKSAYYSLSKIYHPDIVGTDDTNAIENFRLITESYDILSDSQLKSEYDLQLESLITTSDLLHSVHPHKDFNLIFKTRNADMIFRSRQEAALQREKLLNPKKFRAGAFKLDLHERSASNVSKLERRIDNLDTLRPFRKDVTGDGSDFYRMHLLDTIRRRRSDLLNYVDSSERLYRQSSSSGDEISILVGLGTIIFFFIIFILIIADYDLPGYLDQRLDNDSMKEVDEDAKKSVNYSNLVVR